MATFVSRANILIRRIVASVGTNRRHMRDDVRRRGLASSSLQVLVAFFVGASLTLPEVALSSVAHDSSLKDWMR